MVDIGIVFILLAQYTISCTASVETTSGWTMVMKFATGQDLGGANSVYDLWTGTFTVNEGDEQVMSIETGSKTYKSSIVDKWADYNISAVRVSFVNDGQEKAYVVFDGRNCDKKSWFTKSRILSSSWEDLNTHSITNYDSIDGYVSATQERRFYMHHSFNGCDNDRGWFIVTEKGGTCSYAHAFNILYSAKSEKEKSIDQTSADVFTIWVFIEMCIPNPCGERRSCSSHCVCHGNLLGGNCDHHTCQPFDCNKVCTHECVCIDDYFGTECEDVNGGFSEWGSYGSCSRTCGTGIDEGWSEWNEWGSCSQTCGSGTQQKTRTCSNPLRQHGGADCENNPSTAIANQACNTADCSPVCPNGSTQFSCTCRNHVINMTSENLSEVIAALKEELKVDKTKTSLSVRQKTSVEDSRTSAKTIGAVGAVMLAVPFVLIILSDLNIVYKYLSKNSEKRHTSHQDESGLCDGEKPGCP